MKVKELKEKSIEELNTVMLDLLKEQFNLRMQKAMSEMSKVHLFKRVRRDIARVKTILNERGQ